MHLQLEKRKSNQGETENYPSTKEKPIYCKFQWLAGIVCILGGGAIQFSVLPYCDLVLISTNMISGVVFNTFLSIKFLDEKFVWKYDLPALTLMCVGALTIVLLANTDETMYTPEQQKALLKS